MFWVTEASGGQFITPVVASQKAGRETNKVVRLCVSFSASFFGDFILINLTFFRFHPFCVLIMLISLRTSDYSGGPTSKTIRTFFFYDQ